MYMKAVIGYCVLGVTKPRCYCIIVAVALVLSFSKRSHPEYLNVYFLNEETLMKSCALSARSPHRQTSVTRNQCAFTHNLFCATPL